MRADHLLAVLLVTVVGAPGAASGQNEGALRGRWESVVSMPGGVGEIIEFRDKHLVISSGLLIRGLYRADSVLTVSGSQGGALTRFYLVKDDTLLAWTSASPGPVRMIRTADSESRSGLVGVWSYPAPDRPELPTFETFRTDSTYRMWIPIRSDSAEYSVRGDRIMTRLGTARRNMYWRLNDIGLELIRDEGRSQHTRQYIRERQ